MIDLNVIDITSVASSLTTVKISTLEMLGFTMVDLAWYLVKNI
jgi:hypothetical protein